MWKEDGVAVSGLKSREEFLEDAIVELAMAVKSLASGTVQVIGTTQASNAISLANHAIQIVEEGYGHP